MSQKRACVGGGAGFIGSHLAKKLKADGFYVICADWKENEFMSPNDFCHEFRKVDLRQFANCLEVTKGCTQVFNMAADMGGMGFIESNQSVLVFSNTMISANMLEASRQNGVERYFFASTACVYNEDKQLDPSNPGLKEADAWPAKPQDTYGLEKLYAEEMALAYGRDFPMKVRIARYHNVYGPHGTWKGGREKVPAAFGRKAAVSTESFEVWGDGEQTRSFMFIDDCVQGTLAIINGDYGKPLNLGTEEMISMNDFARLAMKCAGKSLPIKNVPGPQGVRGRNSDNTLIKEQIKWAPSISIDVGMQKTYDWINEQVKKEANVADLASSKVVAQIDDSLKSHAGGGGDRPKDVSVNVDEVEFHTRTEG